MTADRRHLLDIPGGQLTRVRTASRYDEREHRDGNAPTTGGSDRARRRRRARAPAKPRCAPRRQRPVWRAAGTRPSSNGFMYSGHDRAVTSPSSPITNRQTHRHSANARSGQAVAMLRGPPHSWLRASVSRATKLVSYRPTRVCWQRACGTALRRNDRAAPSVPTARSANSMPTSARGSTPGTRTRARLCGPNRRPDPRLNRPLLHPTYRSLDTRHLYY